MAYGITTAGFVIKDLQTIKTELQADFKSAYGDDLDVSDESATGQLIGNLSKKLSNQWELQQAIYESVNPDRSENISLDGVSALTGTIRLAATSSTSTVALYGTIGTVIPQGQLIRQQETNEEFELDAQVTIELSNIIDMTFSVAIVLNNTTYTITINGNVYSYTSDSDATEEEIVAGLIADIDSGSDPVLTTDNLDGTGRIYSDDGIVSFVISVDANLQRDSQGSPGNYSSVNKGSISVPANTLNIIVNPISGLDSVNNIVAGSTGREIETDQELRIRRRELLTGIGAATDEAIRQSVLQEISGVINCLVISNRTDNIVNGRPPHSFETIVSGGDEDEIAQAIWENMPAGIYPEGAIVKTITDSTGKEQTIRFSRPTNVYLWARVTYELNLEETFPDNGEQAVKDSIVAWAQANLNVGDNVIYQRLSIPVYEVPGIGEITIELATSATPTGPPGSYTEANVTIADDEISIWDDSRITMVPA